MNEKQRTMISIHLDQKNWLNYIDSIATWKVNFFLHHLL
jgi:hypothetical protein